MRQRTGARVRGCAGNSNWTPRAGTGPAPAAHEIAESRHLTQEANRRLAALRSLLHEQREQAALI